jgi:ribonuclease III
MNEAEFLAALGKDILDCEPFRLATTHRSAGNAHNERLEFLGDAVLNLAIAATLFSSKVDADEGTLSRMRAQLVRHDTLAELADDINLKAQLKLGQGEGAKGLEKTSILADALEAVLGAVFVVRGYASAQQLVLNLYADRLNDLPLVHALKDPKSQLQELLQARGLSPPVYQLTQVHGAAHQRAFSVRCQIEAFGIRAEGVGSSKKSAEQAAAAGALEQLAASGTTA